MKYDVIIIRVQNVFILNSIPTYDGMTYTFEIRMQCDEEDASSRRGVKKITAVYKRVLYVGRWAPDRETMQNH